MKQKGEERLQKYAEWLKKVELLAPLTSFERMSLAEALEVVDYRKGEHLCRQGDEGIPLSSDIRLVALRAIFLVP